MYAGQIVEIGTRRADPQLRAAHPYTRGLLDSFPSVTAPRVKLAGIPGSPPDLRALPPAARSCRAARFATDACATVDMRAAPVAVEPDADHLTACPFVNAAQQAAAAGPAAARPSGPTAPRTTGRRSRLRPRAAGARGDALSKDYRLSRGRKATDVVRRPATSRSARQQRRRRARRRERLGQVDGRADARRPGAADGRADPARRRRRSSRRHAAASAPTRATCRWSSRIRSRR